MPIRECCNINPICCDADSSLPQVAALMRTHHIGDVIVTEEQDGKPVPIGIVTDRDIVVAVVAEDADMSAFTAADLMSAPVAVALESDGVLETLRLMRSRKIRRLPVVSEAGALTGIVTADDIFNLLAMEMSMMADIIIDQPAREARLRR